MTNCTWKRVVAINHQMDPARTPLTAGNQYIPAGAWLTRLQGASNDEQTTTTTKMTWTRTTLSALHIRRCLRPSQTKEKDVQGNQMCLRHHLDMTARRAEACQETSEAPRLAHRNRRVRQSEGCRWKRGAPRLSTGKLLAHTVSSYTGMDTLDEPVTTTIVCDFPNLDYTALTRS